jgi:hypothetical protein
MNPHKFLFFISYSGCSIVTTIENILSPIYFKMRKRKKEGGDRNRQRQITLLHTIGYNSTIEPPIAFSEA